MFAALAGKLNTPFFDPFQEIKRLESGIYTTASRLSNRLRQYFSNVQSGNTYVPPAVTYLGTAAFNTSAGAPSVSATFTQSAGSNRVAVVVVSCSAAATISSVTYAGASMTVVRDTANAGERLAMYYILEASLGADGSKTVTANFSASVRSGIHVFTIAGASQGAPEASDKTNSDSATTLSVPLTCSAGAMCVTGVNCSDTTATISHGSGQTEILESISTSHAVFASSYESVSSGSNTQSSTQNKAATRMCFVAASFAPA